MDTFSLYTSTLKLITAETVPKFNPEIIKLFTDSLGLTFINQKEQEGNVCLANSQELRPEYKETFTSKDLLDYLYAISHSSTYREKNIENLKIDSQNIPVQTDKIKFWKLVQLGGELREIYLLESDIAAHSSIESRLTETNRIMKIIDGIEILYD
nr:type ISP restriction/modification enzyme [uncultured Flavobacterium sp.]